MIGTSLKMTKIKGKEKTRLSLAGPAPADSKESMG